MKNQKDFRLEALLHIEKDVKKLIQELSHNTLNSGHMPMIVDELNKDISDAKRLFKGE